MTLVEVVKLLPRTDCRKCGYPSCLVFAEKLQEHQASPDLCQGLTEEAKKMLIDRLSDSDPQKSLTPKKKAG